MKYDHTYPKFLTSNFFHIPLNMASPNFMPLKINPLGLIRAAHKCMGTGPFIGAWQIYLLQYQ